MAEVSERVRRRVRLDYPDRAEPVIGHLARLTHEIFADGTPRTLDVERIHAAVLIVARGDRRGFDRALALGRTDWRDLLVGAGLGDEGWEGLLEAGLGPASPPPG
ncbi:hypothetical protein ACFVGN_24130 [Streptomyces sp. NPDC057757]|uniref:hypothetical protein n=1 Tax=Streptomyces sp. NPDC057757 TaxID=3346241 RepID=UPI0036C0DA82